MIVAAIVAGAAVSLGSVAIGHAVEGSVVPEMQELCGALVIAEAAPPDLPFLDPSVLDVTMIAPGAVREHADVIQLAAQACGWPEVEVEAWDYGYSGDLDRAVLTAETWAFHIDNTGGEYHELVLFEVSDSAYGMSIREILEHPNAADYLTRRGTASAPPSEEGSTAVDLTPGRWAAVCFVPEGTDSAALDEFLATGDLLSRSGDPHWMLDPGQLVEFSVE